MVAVNGNLPAPVFAQLQGRKPLSRALFKLSFPPLEERPRSASVVVKAAGDTSDSSTSLSLVESVQNVWEKPEDRYGIIGLGFAAIIGLWASTNLINAIDKLPIVPGTLEIIGILFSSWFTYRYLLFKPDREELLKLINKSIAEILGNEELLKIMNKSVAEICESKFGYRR